MDILNIHTLYRTKHPSLYSWDHCEVCHLSAGLVLGHPIKSSPWGRAWALMQILELCISLKNKLGAIKFIFNKLFFKYIYGRQQRLAGYYNSELVSLFVCFVLSNTQFIFAFSQINQTHFKLFIVALELINSVWKDNLRPTKKQKHIIAIFITQKEIVSTIYKG